MACHRSGDGLILVVAERDGKGVQRIVPRWKICKYRTLEHLRVHLWPRRRSRPSEFQSPNYAWASHRRERSGSERFGREVTWSAQIRRVCLAALFVFGVVMAGNSARDLRVQSSARGVDPIAHSVLNASRIDELKADLDRDAALTDRLQKEAASPLLLTNPQSCTIVAKQGRTVFASGTNGGLIPASTQKLATGFAALQVLGAETRFETTVRGVRSGDHLVGPLTIVGGGDPSLATDEYQKLRELPSPVYARIDDLIRPILDSGIRSIPEGLQVDATIFDDERRPASWLDVPGVDVEIGSLGGLLANGGYDDPLLRQVAVDPGIAAGQLIAEALRREGVSVGEAVSLGIAESDSKVLARVESPTVAELVAELLANSDNLTAEMLTKQMGKKVFHEGSTAAGLRAIHQVLQDAAIPLDHLRMVDGSGLSRENRATCETLLGILFASGREGILARGLSVGGEVGTLRSRLGDEAVKGKIVAKTGTLFNVSGLAGWAENPEGEYAFVTLQNGVGLSAGRVQEDRLATLLTQPVGSLDGG